MITISDLYGVTISILTANRPWVFERYNNGDKHRFHKQHFVTTLTMMPVHGSYDSKNTAFDFRRELTMSDRGHCRMGRGAGGDGWRTADELDSGKPVDTARLKNGESVQLGSSVPIAARLPGGAVPVGGRLAIGASGCTWSVQVVEHAVLGHLQSFALERSDCKCEKRVVGVNSST